MTEVAKGANGRGRSRPRGKRPRARRLIEAAEAVFAELGYHDASIVKITEHAGVAQGTFYLYFTSKKEIFDELVRDLNGRVRHAMKEGSSQGANRLQAELLGFQAYFRFTGRAPGALPDHPAGRVRLARDAPLPLRAALGGLRRGAARGRGERARSAPSTPRSLAWALMGMGELIGMRWILWGEDGDGGMPQPVLDEIARIIAGVLEAR